MKFFKTFIQDLDSLLYRFDIKKIDEKRDYRLISKDEELELYQEHQSSLYHQLPDLVTDTYRYAVTYSLHTFKSVVDITTSYLGLFKKRRTDAWYVIELIMHGEPVSITFVPSVKEDRPVCVYNRPENASIRFFKTEDKNLYSDIAKRVHTANSDADRAWLNKPVTFAVKDIHLKWDKIRYKGAKKNIVPLHEKDRVKMISEIMIEHTLRTLKCEINRDMRSGKLMRVFTDGEIEKNMLVAEEQEKSVLPFI